jgi:hypothetical protein
MWLMQQDPLLRDLRATWIVRTRVLRQRNNIEERVAQRFLAVVVSCEVEIAHQIVQYQCLLTKVSSNPT